MNNPIWLMTSAFPGQSFDQVIARAKSVGAQGLELCVFRRDGTRKDHTATHLDYETFDLDAAKKVVEACNKEGLRVSVFAALWRSSGAADDGRNYGDSCAGSRFGGLSGGLALWREKRRFVHYAPQGHQSLFPLKS